MDNKSQKVEEIKATASRSDSDVNKQKEEYKAKQQELIRSFVIGGKDPFGYSIHKVLARGDEHVIYEVLDLPPQESIRIFIDTMDEDDTVPVDRFNEIKPKFDEFLSILFKYECDISYKKRAAGAINMAIRGKTKDANALFDKIQEDAGKEHKEKILGRLSYQGGGIALSAILILVSSAFYFFRTTEFVSNNMLFFHVLLASTFASFGGFLSISLKVKELVVDRGLSKYSYFMYGIERIIISIIGGIFIFLLMKGDIAFGFLANGDSNMYAIMAGCLLAGFSETLVPNTLRNLEASNK